MSHPALPQPILDYASPCPRGKVRLPARSELEMHADADSVEVVERLAGKAGAVAAIIFAGLMFLLMSVQAYVVFRTLVRHDFPIGIPAAVVGVVLVGGLWVMAAVVNNTWRRTILLANADGIRLRFVAPLTGSMRYVWDADRIEALRVEATEPAIAIAGVDLSRSGALAELQIHPVGGSVAHLFTDHEGFRLVPIAEAILRAIGRDGHSTFPYPAAAG